uniref:Uncharacterized protein AlNc14C2G267 n=1 Tax=Albugo laibachii Nc14 TaxID=890382 RepID=F0VZC9_9STRA|nr:conserved hypothetical protein [Albugo laibachii Nc14]|eukprot:CCA14159.1 conserved hypothetical protein [Albugo laibachii Nc14]
MRSFSVQERWLQQFFLISLVTSVLAFVIVYFRYLEDWGAQGIKKALQMPMNESLATLTEEIIDNHTCTGCVLGINAAWPTNTHHTAHFLDTYAGNCITVLIAMSIAIHGLIAISYMIWPTLPSDAPQPGMASNGIMELWYIIEQGQLIGMISHLRLRGTPVFLYQFSRQLTWTNFNLASSSTAFLTEGDYKQLSDEIVGPEGYARLIGLKPSRLFAVTLLTYISAIALAHIICLLSIMLVSCIRHVEELGDVIRYWYRRVTWLSLFLFLVAEYNIIMTGSHAVYTALGSRGSIVYGLLYFVIILLLIAFNITLGFFVLKKIQLYCVPNHHVHLHETYYNEQLENNRLKLSCTMSKFGAFFEGLSSCHRTFFVYRAGYTICMGIIVGLIQNATSQVACLITLLSSYMMIHIWVQPMRLSEIQHLGTLSLYTKLFHLFWLCFLTHSNLFPQSYRDTVSYAIIIQSLLVVGFLIARHFYLMKHQLQQVHTNYKLHGSEALRIARRHESRRTGHTQLYFELETPIVREENARSPSLSAEQCANAISKSSAGPELRRRVTWFETILHATGLNGRAENNQNEDKGLHDGEGDPNKLVGPSTISSNPPYPPPSRNPFSGSRFSVFSRGGRPHTSIFHLFRNASQSHHEHHRKYVTDRRMRSDAQELVDSQLELSTISTDLLKISNHYEEPEPKRNESETTIKKIPSKGILNKNRSKTNQSFHLRNTPSNAPVQNIAFQIFNARIVKFHNHANDLDVSFAGSSEFGSSQWSQLDEWFQCSEPLEDVEKSPAPIPNGAARQSIYTVLERIESSKLSETTLESMAEACLKQTGNRYNSTVMNDLGNKKSKKLCSTFRGIPVLQSDGEMSELSDFDEEDDAIIEMMSDEEDI